jgi:arylsulfatase A-like enzyme
MRYKGVIGQGISDRLVNTGIDIMASMLDYAEIAQPEKLPGRSLRQLAEGAPPSPWRDYVVVENHMIQGGPVEGVIPRVHGRMVRSARYKYCLYEQGQRREAWFDMQKDPGEMVNISTPAANAGIIREHRAYLKEHGERYGDEVALNMLAA